MYPKYYNSSLHCIYKINYILQASIGMAASAVRVLCAKNTNLVILCVRFALLCAARARSIRLFQFRVYDPKINAFLTKVH